MSDAGPRLRVVRGDATPDEIAAIVAAASTLTARGAVLAAAAEPTVVSHWVQASRLVARRKGMTRGPWGLTGRLGRRSRA